MTGAPITFDARVSAFLERIYRQQPVAVIQFGSVLRPEDFVAGVSDFDLVIISHEPLQDVDNDLNCDYFFLSPHQFVAELAAGNMFWISALQSGRVLFDPHGFMKNLTALIASGLVLRTTLTTLYNTLEIVTRQLSVAMNLYFSGERDRGVTRSILKRAYSAAKGLGAYHAIAATGEDPHGFEAIARAVRRYPDVEALMRRARARLDEEAGGGGRLPGAPLLVEEDALGGPILEVERAFCDSVTLLPGRRPTNDLIREYKQRRYPPLERIIAVALDLAADRHLIAAETARGYCVFGSLTLRGLQPDMVRFELPDYDSLGRRLGWLNGHPPTDWPARP